MWDFAGQEIYYATHQFFLTRRSLYILVDDSAGSHNSVKDDAIRYWLEAVEVLADASPVLIFQNKRGGRSKKLGLGEIKGRFPNVIDVYEGDLAKSDAADQIRSEIEHRVQQLPHIGEEVPARWVDVRTEIERMAASRPIISIDEYYDVYNEMLPPSPDKALSLSRAFHDLGVFLHFQDHPLLRRLIIIRNEWATEAVFALVNDENVKKAGGLFTDRDWSRLWPDQTYQSHYPELMALLEQFELCYQLPNRQSWLAPQLLSPERPEGVIGWASPDDLRLEFHYPFLPKGFVSRLIVRLHGLLVNRNLAWTEGVVLHRASTEALVEITNRDVLTIRCRGPERKEFLSVLTQAVDELNDTYGNLGSAGQVSKVIPCPCDRCRASPTPHTYDLDNLIQRRADKIPTIQCVHSYKDMEVLELLDGVSLAGFLDPLASREGDQREDWELRRRGIEASSNTFHIENYGPAAFNTGVEGNASMTNTSPSIDPTHSRWDLPDRLQVSAAAGLACGGVLAAAYGVGKGWHWDHLDTWFAVGGVAAIGAIAGSAAGFLIHLFR